MLGQAACCGQAQVGLGGRDSTVCFFPQELLFQEWKALAKKVK